MRVPIGRSRRAKRSAAPDARPTTSSPEIRSLDELHAYWREPDELNRPERYLEHVARSRFLVRLVAPHVPRDARVLEIGCNAGRNLAHLLEAGYEDLTGIEISADALALLRRTYPELAERGHLINASAETAMPRFGDRTFDLVFTMAVLEHIHPSSEWVFAEIARVTDSVLVTIEDEQNTSWRHIPRDYGRIFEALGMRQVEEHELSPEHGFSRKFRARVFRRNEEPRPSA